MTFYALFEVKLRLSILLKTHFNKFSFFLLFQHRQRIEAIPPVNATLL
jgi:hypothetical protein